MIKAIITSTIKVLLDLKSIEYLFSTTFGCLAVCLDEKGRINQFITNNWEISGEEVALMYKYRWTIELVFKKLKQNFQLHLFYSESENGIKTQIWVRLIAHLLLTVLKRLSKSEKAFSNISALVRIHFISHLSLYWVIENGRRSYNKRVRSRNKAPDGVQLLLFD